jgi:polyphosphate kinase 2 (PPK2 family)
MQEYEECLGATRTSGAAWLIVPADDEANAQLIVSRILCDVLEELNMTCP